MARKSNQMLGIAPKMYRQFAAVTLAISGVVAILANGEVNHVIAQSNEQVESQPAKHENFSAKNLVDQRRDAVEPQPSGGIPNIEGQPVASDVSDAVIPAAAPANRTRVILEVQ